MVEVTYTQFALYGIGIFVFLDLILHLIWHLPGFIKRRREKSKTNTLGEISDKSQNIKPLLKPLIIPPEVKLMPKFKPAFPNYKPVQRPIKYPQTKIKLETY